MQLFVTSFIFTDTNNCNLLTNFVERLYTGCSIRFLWDLTDDFPLLRKLTTLFPILFPVFPIHRYDDYPSYPMTT